MYSIAFLYTIFTLVGLGMQVIFQKDKMSLKSSNYPVMNQLIILSQT